MEVCYNVSKEVYAYVFYVFSRLWAKCSLLHLAHNSFFFNVFVKKQGAE